LWFRDAGLYSAAAAIAAATAWTTKGQAFWVWGVLATGGYLVGTAGSFVLALVTLRKRARAVGDDGSEPPAAWRTVLLAVVLGGVVVLPLVVQLVLGVSVSEVGILREAGARLLEHGTPYPDSAELARLVEERGRLAHTAYNVYLPVLALTGVPSALFGPGPLTDPGCT
jgi:hypothetical protein